MCQQKLCVFFVGEYFDWCIGLFWCEQEVFYIGYDMFVLVIDFYYVVVVFGQGFSDGLVCFQCGVVLVKIGEFQILGQFYVVVVWFQFVYQYFEQGGFVCVIGVYQVDLSVLGYVYGEVIDQVLVVILFVEVVCVGDQFVGFLGGGCFYFCCFGWFVMFCMLFVQVMQFGQVVDIVFVMCGDVIVKLVFFVDDFVVEFVKFELFSFQCFVLLGFEIFEFFVQQVCLFVIKLYGGV